MSDHRPYARRTRPKAQGPRHELSARPPSGKAGNSGYLDKIRAARAKSMGIENQENKKPAIRAYRPSRLLMNGMNLFPKQAKQQVEAERIRLLRRIEQEKDALFGEQAKRLAQFNNDEGRN